MGKIYIGQTALRIQLTANIDINNADAFIKYQKPDGTRGEWVASVYDADKGIIYYDMQATTDLDQEGDWIFWTYIEFGNGKVAAGEPVTIYVYPEGD